MPVARLLSGGRAGRGFTLVELLLVVAIVAVLVGLVFPVFTGARRQGRMARCTANLRQLGMACQQYAQDHGAYPNPLQLVESVKEKAILRCPEDREPKYASSYTFRSMLPPDLKPYWERPEQDADSVLVVCNHHLEQAERVRGERRTLGEPRYPFKLVLRAGGAVERVHVDQVREMLVPGDRPTYIRVYPRERGYDMAMR